MANAAMMHCQRRTLSHKGAVTAASVALSHEGTARAASATSSHECAATADSARLLHEGTAMALSATSSHKGVAMAPSTTLLHKRAVIAVSPTRSSPHVPSMGTLLSASGKNLLALMVRGGRILGELGRDDKLAMVVFLFFTLFFSLECSFFLLAKAAK